MLITNEQEFLHFQAWSRTVTDIAVDTETNITDSIVERKLYMIAFGDRYNVFSFHFSLIQPHWWDFFKEILQGPHIKIFHNASFDYQVLLKHDILTDNLYDTMLAEQLLYAGYTTPDGFYSLAEVSERRLKVTRDKSLQTSFTAALPTREQLDYLEDDIRYLPVIKQLQEVELNEHELNEVAKLEFEAVKGFADIEFYGMHLDKDAWMENVKWAEPIVKQTAIELEEEVKADEKLYLRAVEMEKIYLVDRYTVNWNSHEQRKSLLLPSYPNLEGFTKPTLKRSGHKELSLLANKQFDDFNAWMVDTHPDLMADHHIPAGKLTINWGSPPQRLKLFQAVEPQLQGTDKEDLAKTSHPIILTYQKFIQMQKLLTSFGEDFFKYVDSDGAVRTRFNQIASTGRVTSSNPNMQNIPAKELVGTRYRNCFVAHDPRWVFVDSDFISQELIMIAFFSGDPVWAEAIKLGQDLHSVCAQLVFGELWNQAAEKTCAFYHVEDGIQAKQKCKCKAHKRMRDAVKTINFGLAYGMSKYKLAATMRISLQEAENLILDYFRTFPSIGKFLNQLGRFGLDNGYICTPPPFMRVRWFPKWEAVRHKLPAYLKGEYVSWLGTIERASKNMPIQGGSADVTKKAVVLIWNYLRDHNLRNQIRLVAQVHDQITTTCVPEIQEMWKEKLTELMEEAARVVIPSGILKSETAISPFWTK